MTKRPALRGVFVPEEWSGVFFPQIILLAEHSESTGSQ